MKTWGRDSRRSGMRKPRRRVRRIEPLPKIYALQYTVYFSKSNMGLRKMHEWSRTTSVSVSCSCRPRIWSWSGKNKFFREVTVAWAEACGQGHSLVSPQVQRWPCGYSPSIQSRSLLDVPCHCSGPNTCIRSLAATAADIPLSEWGHHIMDGLCQELPAYGIPCSCGRCFI